MLAAVGVMACELALDGVVGVVVFVAFDLLAAEDRVVRDFATGVPAMSAKLCSVDGGVLLVIGVNRKLVLCCGVGLAKN